MVTQETYMEPVLVETPILGLYKVKCDNPFAPLTSPIPNDFHYLNTETRECYSKFIQNIAIKFSTARSKTLVTWNIPMPPELDILKWHKDKVSGNYKSIDPASLNGMLLVTIGPDDKNIRGTEFRNDKYMYRGVTRTLYLIKMDIQHRTSPTAIGSPRYIFQCVGNFNIFN